MNEKGITMKHVIAILSLTLAFSANSTELTKTKEDLIRTMYDDMYEKYNSLVLQLCEMKFPKSECADFTQMLDTVISLNSELVRTEEKNKQD